MPGSNLQAPRKCGSPGEAPSSLWCLFNPGFMRLMAFSDASQRSAASDFFGSDLPSSLHSTTPSLESNASPYGTSSTDPENPFKNLRSSYFCPATPVHGFLQLFLARWYKASCPSSQVELSSNCEHVLRFAKLTSLPRPPNSPNNNSAP